MPTSVLSIPPSSWVSEESNVHKLLKLAGNERVVLAIVKSLIHTAITAKTGCTEIVAQTIVHFCSKPLHPFLSFLVFLPFPPLLKRESPHSHCVSVLFECQAVATHCQRLLCSCYLPWRKSLLTASWWACWKGHCSFNLRLVASISRPQLPQTLGSIGDLSAVFLPACIYHVVVRTTACELLVILLP